MTKCTINTLGSPTPFPHVWEECVGSCHAAMANRFDWRSQLAHCREELGFRRVRFHGILNDDMSLLTKRSGHSRYSFHNIDLIFDFLLSIDMQPFIELSFMPSALASGEQTVFHYRGNVTPPEVWEEWGGLVEALTRHLVNRYGLGRVRQWPFEIWNEPNLPYFWTGTQAQYFTLYRHAACAVKRVDRSIPVGGPSTARNEWISDLLRYCSTSDTPIDFLSTHHYPTDDAVDHGGDMEAQMASTGRGALRRMAERARAEAGNLPLYYTEWSSSPSSRDVYHDGPYAAAFIVKSVMDVARIVDMYSYWAFSDIFEEEGFPSAPFHGGFGLLNIHGIPKPSYHAFRFLRELGHERIAMEWSGTAATLDGMATRTDAGVRVLVCNHDVPLAAIHPETLSISLPHDPPFARAWIERIDDDHANPARLWREQGSPDYPDKRAVSDLILKSRPAPEEVPLPRADGHQELSLIIPPHGVAAIFFER